MQHCGNDTIAIGPLIAVGCRRLSIIIVKRYLNYIPRWCHLAFKCELKTVGYCACISRAEILIKKLIQSASIVLIMCYMTSTI